jgi:uncharacterized protein YecE (DUF72 family)
MVEVDSSYYGMPTAANAQLWAERTPPGFTFNVHKDLQQAMGAAAPTVLYYKDTPAEIRDELWRRFIEALAPLKEAGKLGAVHFQFAPWMLRNREGLAHVRHCVERMEGHLVAVEFRNKSWFGDNLEKTIAFERELDVVHTIVDAPAGFSNSAPCVWEVTNPRLALLRLHGRNKETWNHKGEASSGRFNYWYSAEELDAMVPEIRGVAGLADSMHVVFNTNYEDQGQVNARLLRQLLA